MMFTPKPRPPDFICIGAQKSGTTWFQENLRRHPGIWMPPIKELHYFDTPLGHVSPPPTLASDRAEQPAWRSAVLTQLQQLAAAGDVTATAWMAMHAFLDRNDLWYQSLFGFAPADAITGDVTPSYMLCGPQEIAHMHRVAPDAKLIFLLRHPVERFWSQCRMKYANNTLAPGEAQAMHFFETPLGRPRGEYSRAILRFCEKFDPAQMLLIFYEAIGRQPLEVLHAAWRFLGLEPVNPPPAELRKPVNASPGPHAMPQDLQARITSAYRREMEIMAGVFGGYAESWMNPAATPAACLPARQLTADHLNALKRHPRPERQDKSPAGKIFCISMQRSGTTSVGDWLESHGLVRSGSPASGRLQWTRQWFAGDYEAIFSSPEFHRTDIFEDDPWWCPGFFKIVAERYPDAKFILLERDPDEWFDSLCHHSAGRNPGWTDVHARIYRREADLQHLLQQQPDLQPDSWNLLSILDHREHYKKVYQKHGEEVRAYFKPQPHRLFTGNLHDPDVFAKICAFSGLRMNPAIPVPHSNVRTEPMRLALAAAKAAGTQRQEPITVFVVSWGRPLYLWSCLDALYRLTRSPARFVLLDNAHPDPMVTRVISGFERRGMFDEVLRFETNRFANITRAYEQRLAGLGPLHVYIESDCVIAESPNCWLADMQRIMQNNPGIGVLGSLINPEDFVPRETALTLTGGNADLAAHLAKLDSPERGFIHDPAWAAGSEDFFLTKHACPIHNPPGRLMMLRTDIMRSLGFQLDGALARLLRDRGFEPAVTPRVIHRHLSLLNIFDYADDNMQARHDFFTASSPGSP